MFRTLIIILMVSISLPISAEQSTTPEDRHESPPTSVEAAGKNADFATMLNRIHPGNRIGYRFFEHFPIVFGPVPGDSVSAGLDPAQVDKLEKQFQARAGAYVYRREIREEKWLPQNWTFYIVPVQEGFDLLWVIETFDQGLNTYYGVQQCFRMGGLTNAEWRREIAETPAFSEYDLWAEQEKKGDKFTSLSYVRRKDKWESLPAIRQHVVCRTPLGLEMDLARSGGNLETITGIEPYGPSVFQPDIDCGLATRSTLDDTWVCGIYWERTAHITNHHPADCLHPFVNIGPIPAHSKRAIRGKIYWMKATRDDLFTRWSEEFGAR
ncbi:MAG TPA: hypothetical protein PLZ55_07735 [bacterium]|nr:hypothetical protein [bacterium]